MVTPLSKAPETKTKHHYIDNKEFLRAVIEYRKSVRRAKRLKEEKPRVTEYIGECFIKIANQLAFKSNFINYSYREEMISDAIENCLTYVDNFDPKKSSNPFAYFTQITYYAFVRRIQKEKRQLHTKYKYIESLNIDDIIRQANDGSEYANSFVDFLKKQADTAHQELSEIKKDVSKTKRRPKYLQAIEDAKVDQSP
jgi:DNA-directed RNA polymerase specialized sigma24 family protein